jgi:cytochrome b561
MGPSAVLGNLRGRLHLLVTLLAAWLILTSPWVSMLRRLPPEPGWLDRAHVWLGLAALPLALAYLYDCIRVGAWRQNFPWLPGEWGGVAADLKGLVRGRIPPAEGGGLFGAIAGLTLLALVATALTGVAWFWTQGTAAALDWRDRHILAAHVLVTLAVAHIVTVSLHLLDFLRD